VAKICIIDDDPAMDLLVEGFRYRGYEARRLATVAEALRAIDAILASDVVVLDILMPSPEGASAQASSASAMELFTKIRKRNSKLPIIALSATQDSNIIQALAEDPATTFISKWESHPIREIVNRVNAVLGIATVASGPRPFIVHGHNDQLKLELKNYIQNVLRLPEPVILHEQPNLGRTIIEKFEDYAAASAFVFVLLTPDDVAADAKEADDKKRRARQNVIFEMGYFLGVLGRESGRVVLLYSGPLELPSDLAGVGYIDISNGIEAAGENIRREVAHVIA
jgi:predicted nucleotide-binding protein